MSRRLNGPEKNAGKGDQRLPQNIFFHQGKRKVLVNVRKTDALTFPVKTIEITTKHLILCSTINNMWGKTLKTPNKLAGPVGKEGVLGEVNKWRNAGKTTKT